jgi:hypothetical protein
MGLITIGLAQIKVGEAAPSGTMPETLTKIGKTYKDTCKIAQDASDLTEHFEDVKAAPEIRKKSRKIPKLTFSLMNANSQMLADYVGGVVTEGKWGYDGDELVANKAIFVETEQGLDFEIPNGDVEAVINSDMSAKGIFLVDFTITPLTVAAGKAIRGVPKEVAGKTVRDGRKT